jgi:pimeloyl-ACP methyl ester carboxylesterase
MSHQRFSRERTCLLISFRTTLVSLFLITSAAASFDGSSVLKSIYQPTTSTLTASLFYDLGLQGIGFNEPKIDTQGRLLLAGNQIGGFKIYSISPNGTLNWQVPRDGSAFPRSYVSMAIGPNDRVYVMDNVAQIYAFDSSGNPVPGWPVNAAPAGAFNQGVFYGDPIVVDKNTGVVYVGAGGTVSAVDFPTIITALNPDGSKKWSNIDHNAGANCQFVFGPNGNIYLDLGFSQLVTIARDTGNTICKETPAPGFHGGGFVGNSEGVFGSFRSTIYALGMNCNRQGIFDSNRGDIFLSNYEQGTIYGNDRTADGNHSWLLAVTKNGTFLWRNQVIEGAFLRTIRNGVLYVTGQDNTDSNKEKLFFLSTLTGEILSSLETAPYCSRCGVTVKDDGTTYLTDVNSAKIFKVNGGTTPPSIARPLIFIPGVGGSVLDGQTVIGNLWPGIENYFRLSLNPENEIDSTIFSPDVIRYSNLAGDTYGTLLDTLKTQGDYREYNVKGNPNLRTTAGCDLSQKKSDPSQNPNLFVFAYDWRKSNIENAAKLRDYVGCVQQFYGQDVKIDVLTHSMGGLLARRYMLTFPTDHHIGKFITIAAPWLGAPKAIDVLETGTFVDSKWKIVGVLPRVAIKSLTEFFPSVHELLPSSSYFGLGGRPYLLNGTVITNYDQFVNIMNQRFPRSTPGTASRVLHDRQGQDDGRVTPTDVSNFHLYGVRGSSDQPRRDTIGSVGISRVCSPGLLLQQCYIRYDYSYTYGDITVPRLSAERRGIGPGLDLNNSNAVLLPFYDANNPNSVSHTGLTSNPNVLGAIVNILRSSNSSQVKSSLNASAATGVTAQTSYYVKLGGVSQITVNDSSGHNTNPLSDPPDQGIDSVVTNTTSQKSADIILPLDQTYTMLFQTNTDPINLEITRESDVPDQAIRYQDLALPSSVMAKITFTPQGVNGLVYDNNGDGIFETTVNPTVSVSGTSAQDVTPPTISASETRQQSSIVVTLTASDSGSGVRAIYYSTDGTIFQPYTGAFTIDRARTQFIYAFADDNVSNRSGLLAYQLALANCSFSLSTTSQPFTAMGGSGSVNVTATASDCGWTSATNANWITIGSSSTVTGNGIVNYIVSANISSQPRTGTISIAGQTFTINQAGLALGVPILVSEETSTRAIAVDSVLWLRGPFRLDSPVPWGADKQTRVMLFAMNFDLQPGELVTADAEDASHRIYPLTVEYVGRVPGFEWLNSVIVRLNDEMGDIGDVLVRLNMRGASSNRVRVGIGHTGGGLPDDLGSVPTPGRPLK